MTQSPIAALLSGNPRAFLDHVRNHDTDARVNSFDTLDDIGACESHDVFNECVPANERRSLDAILLLVGVIACFFVFILPLFWP